MDPNLEAALAWFADPVTRDPVVGLLHGHTLAAAVRELRANRDKWLGLFNESEQFQNGPTKRADRAEAGGNMSDIDEARRIALSDYLNYLRPKSREAAEVLYAAVQYMSDRLTALKAMRCETCQHRFVGMAPAGRPHHIYCHQTMVPVPELGTQTFAQCDQLGHGCRAWQTREGT